MEIINISNNEAKGLFSSVFSKSNDEISHHWNIKIESASVSIYLEFMWLEENKTIYNIENKTFNIDDQDILQLQSCFIRESGIKIASEITILFNSFNIINHCIPTKITLKLNSYIVNIDIQLKFEGYFFYMMKEEKIRILSKNENIADITLKEVNQNSLVFNH